MLNKIKELNNMTRYTLQVKLPSLGWVVAIKTRDLFYMARKRARLIKQGHEVKLTKKKGK
jgi:hypothetical protein